MFQLRPYCSKFYSLCEPPNSISLFTPNNIISSSSKKIYMLIIQLLVVVVSISLGSPAGSSVQLCHNDERQALLAFKTAFPVDNYLYLGYCDSAYSKTRSWMIGSKDCCKWDGVTCDPFRGHVTELDLSCSLLSGSFPTNSSLFRLSRLRHIDLSSNGIFSSIPAGFGRLSDLTYLNLSYSFFSGQVPPEIGWLSSLTTLDLSGNFVSMPNLKTVIANLTDLRKLSLSDLSINTYMPPMIANLSKLTSLELANCGLQGEFPTKVLSLPELRVLNLGYNDMLHADFSTSDVQWRSPLEVVDLSSCNFTGKLPDSIGDSSNISLISFKIDRCGFHGDIPSWTWNVTEEISLHGNSLSGSLPPAVDTEVLARLSTIDLSGNRIGGTIPAWLFTLPSLNYLHLEDNLFTGIDQFTIANGSTNSVLLEFWANNNQLQGQIPEALFGLQLLYLQKNNLTGTIPLSMLFGLQNLSSLSLSDNSLSIIDDMGSESISSMPRFLDLGLSSCNIGHFPIFLRDQKNLTELELSNNGIHGSVPEWFLDMNLLEFLDLSHNSLTGGLEHLPWQNIYEIDIGSNMLEGAVPIPPAPISYFRASNNRFTGEIPSSSCHQPYLELLDISQNNLTGNIPDCFASLVSSKNLFRQAIDLSQNQLQGVIPSNIFEDCPSLFTFRLNGNRIEGPIPQSLSNCMQLQFLDLGTNNLNGTFPHWLGVLPDLEVLLLGSNNLQGSLMNSNLTNPFPKLRILDISNNDLTGGLPGGFLMSMKAMIKVDSSLSRELYMNSSYYPDSMNAWFKGFIHRLDAVLNSLVSIDASRNKLEGSIPEAIGDLVSLRWLNLAHNNFTGNIPPSLGNLSLLESLDLSFNRLYGKIPNELVNLNSLEFFNVSENHLVGSVPTGKQFDTFLDDSYLGNLGLCGAQLTNKCKKPIEASRAAAATGSNGESSGLNVWEIALMGYGFGMFVGSVWGYYIFWEKNPYWLVRLIFKIEVFVMLHRMRSPKK